jgi:UDP-glucuronate decarboxylase
MKAFTGDSFISTDIDFIMANLESIDARDKKVLVTGGAGFLGSWISETLLSMGAHVTCIDKLSSGSESNISYLLSSPNFAFVKGDVSETYSIDTDVDIVFHMASRASPFEFKEYPLEILKSNTLGTLNSLEIARKKKARFLFTSTSEVYGDPAVVPTPETYFGNVNSIGVRGCYDEAKRCGEAYVMAYKRQFNLDIRIARIFNTYGPRMRNDGIYARALPRFLSQALKNEAITVFGEGKQTRSFCYVSDQIAGLLTFAFHPEAGGEVINIGSNHEITIMMLAKRIKELVGSSSEITFNTLPPDDPRRRQPDISKAKGTLGWQPKVDLNDGLTKTVKWFKETKHPL